MSALPQAQALSTGRTNVNDRVPSTDGDPSGQEEFQGIRDCKMVSVVCSARREVGVIEPNREVPGCTECLPSKETVVAVFSVVVIAGRCVVLNLSEEPRRRRVSGRAKVAEAPTEACWKPRSPRAAST